MPKSTTRSQRPGALAPAIGSSSGWSRRHRMLRRVDGFLNYVGIDLGKFGRLLYQFDDGMPRELISVREVLVNGSQELQIFRRVQRPSMAGEILVGVNHGKLKDVRIFVKEGRHVLTLILRMCTLHGLV